MTSTASMAPASAQTPPQPGPGVSLLAGLMALWCLGFAAVNVIFESTAHFSDGRYADYAAGITVMNWLVVGLKVLGAMVALLAATRSPRVSPALVTAAVWGVFATLGVYVLGSVAQAVGMVTGVAGSAERIDVAGVVYLLFFLLGAAGFGVLAVSHTRRHSVRRRFAVLGVLGAPVVLGVILLAVPALLIALDIMPAS